MTTLSPTLRQHNYRKLPKWVPLATLLTSIAAATVILALAANLTPAGVGVFAAAIHIVALTAISRKVEGARWAKDRLATALVTCAFLIAIIPLISLLWIVIADGAPHLGWSFLTTDMVGVFGSMTTGGAFHAIIGTLYVTGIASLIAIPLGIFTAVYLVEYGRGTLARAITVLVDVMTGIPSIVAGLFGYTLFLIVFGPAYKSSLIGAVALALLMTPVVVRNTEEMLRLVPNELREAAYALAVPKWLTIVKVVLRTAAGGITTGVVIAIARVIGETAPLLVTVGMATGVNWDAFDGRIATLPVFVYNQYAQGGAAADRAWAGALTLIALVMILNIVARLVNHYFSPKGAR